MVARLVVCCLALCACTPSVSVVHDYCSLGKPICTSKQDKLTDPTAKAILDHNLSGQKICDWSCK